MQEVFNNIVEKFQSKIEALGGASGSNEVQDVAVKEIEWCKEIVEKFAKEFATDTNVGSNGWIPCSERLPETNESVLCWAKSTARGGDVCFVGSCHNGFWFLQSSADTHSFPGQYVIVAWQPLPLPYTKGE